MFHCTVNNVGIKYKSAVNHSLSHSVLHFSNRCSLEFPLTPL